MCQRKVCAIGPFNQKRRQLAASDVANDLGSGEAASGGKVKKGVCGF
jgi:hypothetical protein